MAHPPRRPQIVSVALPASLTLDIPHLREKTARLGFVSRALATFRVEEAIIYRDRGGAGKDRGKRHPRESARLSFPPHYPSRAHFHNGSALLSEGAPPTPPTHHHPHKPNASP